jgi:hypothetical protein
MLATGFRAVKTLPANPFDPLQPAKTGDDLIADGEILDQLPAAWRLDPRAAQTGRSDKSAARFTRRGRMVRDVTGKAGREFNLAHESSPLCIEIGVGALRSSAVNRAVMKFPVRRGMIGNSRHQLSVIDAGRFGSWPDAWGGARMGFSRPAVPVRRKLV